LRRCAICGGTLSEFIEGEFKRYYCDRCNIPYYVYISKPKTNCDRLFVVDDYLETHVPKFMVALQFILIGVLELFYRLFFF
jgi:hypothetical protein